MNDITPIFYATDNNYIFMTCVSISSLLSHCASQEQKIIILTTQKLTDEGEQCVSRIKQLYEKASIQYYVVGEKYLEGVSTVIQYISTATYLRLLIPELFIDYDKCIYLDSDLLVTDDISFLQNESIDDYLCAGVRDEEFMFSFQNIEATQMKSVRSYINAGVLVMNLKKMKEEAICAKFKTLMMNQYPLQDQDVINIACEGKVCLLPGKYNCYSRSNRYPADMVIWHFSGGPDVHPWENRKAKGYDLWWNEAAKLKGCTMYATILSKCGELNDQYDILEKLGKQPGKPVYIWGFTYKTGYLLDYLKANGIENIAAFIDSDARKQKSQYRGINVISPRSAELRGSIVINAVQRHREDVNNLISKMEIADITVIQYYERSLYYYRALCDEYFEQEVNEMLALNYGIIN